jgi:hypothetical protein
VRDASNRSRSLCDFFRLLQQLQYLVLLAAPLYLVPGCNIIIQPLPNYCDTACLLPHTVVEHFYCATKHNNFVPAAKCKYQLPRVHMKNSCMANAFACAAIAAIGAHISFNMSPIFLLLLYSSLYSSCIDYTVVWSYKLGK